eukprot:TRINITY_DN1774_c0_g1_i6.p1 TRINITY_DN1774_c0_g1~~TRINITY_DN1774_c0_g1_i6.p1  ORF type:complete len:283 (+),score=46.20 TRINITY_DN1774_c0_g1_i6:303-1151(+)
MINFFFYAGEWRIATTGNPNGEGKLFDRDSSVPFDEIAEEDYVTFSKLFWRLFREKGYLLPSEEDRDKCFMFELSSHENNLIVRYPEPILQLHGVRNLSTLDEELPESYAEKYHWDLVPEVFGFNTIEEVVESAKGLNAMEQEGYVVVDSQFNRVKIKCPMYVQLSLLSKTDKGGLNKRRILTIIKINEDEEFLTYYPEYTELYLELKSRYDSLVQTLESLREEIKTFQTKKDLSLFAKERNLNKHISPFLYWTMDHPDESARVYLSQQRDKLLEQLIDKLT